MSIRRWDRSDPQQGVSWTEEVSPCRHVRWLGQFSEFFYGSCDLSQYPKPLSAYEESKESLVSPPFFIWENWAGKIAWLVKCLYA